VSHGCLLAGGFQIEMPPRGLAESRRAIAGLQRLNHQAADNHVLKTKPDE